MTLEANITYASLQAQLDKEFSVPAARQRIKHGFPPRELQAPSSELAEEPLPINHGDRITLEILPDPAAGKFYVEIHDCHVLAISYTMLFKIAFACIV